MSEFITRTARLVPYAKRPKQVPSFVTAYSYEPLPDEPAAQLGSLFAVLEVLVSGRSSEEVVDLVVETLGDAYYNQDHGQADPLARFEAAIKTVNQELAAYVSQGNAAWIGKLSAVLAIQVGQDLHVTHTGSAEAFLYRHKATTRITSSQPNGRPSTPSKTFGSIASGTLEVGDRLLLATPALIHHLALKKLHDVIAHNSPNAAIAELTQLLEGGTSERVAALVVEITTPELAALQVRSEQPDEIQLGSPETPLEAAKYAAAPIAQATVTSGKRLGGAAQQGWHFSLPYVRRAGLALARGLRWFLTGHGARIRIAVIAAIIVVSGAGWWLWQHSSAHATQLINRYRSDYAQLETARRVAATGDRTQARVLLTQLQQEVGNLKSSPDHTTLDTLLKHTALPEAAPTSVANLAAAVNVELDQLDDLKRLSSTPVADLTSAKAGQPRHLEIAGGKAYLFGGTKAGAILITDLTSHSVTKSAALADKIGDVVSTTLSSTGDGVYLLTDRPSVWFYRFDNDTLTEQTIALGQWPKSQAIAAYAGNLYLLSDGHIYKHVKTLSGFSPKSDYLGPSQIAQLTGATSLAVDGLVYAHTPTGLNQYLSGTLKQTGTDPNTLANAAILRSLGDGNTILAVSPATSRFGLWDVRQSLAFAGQYQLTGIDHLYDAAYDAKSKVYYALIADQLVRFTP